MRYLTTWIKTSEEPRGCPEHPLPTVGCLDSSFFTGWLLQSVDAPDAFFAAGFAPVNTIMRVGDREQTLMLEISCQRGYTGPISMGVRGGIPQGEIGQKNERGESSGRVRATREMGGERDKREGGVGGVERDSIGRLGLNLIRHLRFVVNTGIGDLPVVADKFLASLGPVDLPLHLGRCSQVTLTIAYRSLISRRTRTFLWADGELTVRTIRSMAKNSSRERTL